MDLYPIARESAQPRHISDVMQSVLAKYDLRQGESHGLTAKASYPNKPVAVAPGLPGQHLTLDPMLTCSGTEV